MESRLVATFGDSHLSLPDFTYVVHQVHLHIQGGVQVLQVKDVFALESGLDIGGGNPHIPATEDIRTILEDAGQLLHSSLTTSVAERMFLKMRHNVYGRPRGREREVVYLRLSNRLPFPNLYKFRPPA